MKEYCLGFAFNTTGNEIILIRKNRPDYQAGKLNGVGGKLEEGETPDFAMQREFYEETGITTLPEQWKYVLTMEGLSFKVYTFKTILHDAQFESVQTMTDEEVAQYETARIILGHYNTMRNLSMIIMACLIDDPEMQDITIKYNV